MDRCKDYLRFVVWFAGIGYGLLWPFCAVDDTGRAFGASIICGRHGHGVLAVLCAVPHPVPLPFGLHLMGLAAASAVGARLCWRLLRRALARLAVRPVDAARAIRPAPLPVRLPPPPIRRLRTVKPRQHFGLRGTLH